VTFSPLLFNPHTIHIGRVGPSTVQATRPARLAAGLALAPAGERLLFWLSARLRVGRPAALAAAMVAEAALLLAGLAFVALAAGGAR
jgi:hypothetical protein